MIRKALWFVFWLLVGGSVGGLLLMAAANAHEFRKEECTYIAHAAGWIAQDRNRGLTKAETKHRHLASVMDCMNHDPKCGFKDTADVRKMLNLLDSIYALPKSAMDPDGKIDPRVTYSQSMSQCMKFSGRDI